MDKKEERLRLSQARKAEAGNALDEYREREAAINRNTERLRALRLARDAQDPPPAAKSAKRKSPKVGLATYLKRETDAGRET